MSECWKRGCRDFRVEQRWVEVNQKQNKPPEELYEIKKICNECGRTFNSAYLTREQVAEIDKRREGEPLQKTLG